MRQIQRWLTGIVAMLAVGIGFGSCMREQRETGGNRGEAKEVHVVLSMQVEQEEDLRLAQNIDQTHAPASGNLAAGKTTTPAMSEKNLLVHLAISRDGEVQYQTKEFVKVPGRNRATYEGTLRIPQGGTGEYKITAIVLREVGEDGVKYAEVNAENQLVRAMPAEGLVPATGTVVKTKGPYLAESAFTLSAGQVRLDNQVLHFKPSGMLIRVQIQNQLATAKTISTVKLKTNAFFTSWTYNLTALTGGNLLKGEVANTAEWEREYTLPAPITLAPGAYSDFYYLWVMPRKAETGLLTSWTIEGQNVFERSDDTPLPATLPEGQGRMLLVLKDATADVCPANAFDYLNQFAGFAQEDGSEPKLYNEQMFARSLDPMNAADFGTLLDPQRGNMRFSMLDATHAEVKAAVASEYSAYHIPSLEEWGLIFPTTDPGQFNTLRENPALRLSQITGQTNPTWGDWRGLISKLEIYHPFVSRMTIPDAGGLSWVGVPHPIPPTEYYTDGVHYPVDSDRDHLAPFEIPYSTNPSSNGWATRQFDERWARFLTDYFPIATSDSTNFQDYTRPARAVERVSFDGGATVETVTSEYDFTPRLKKRTEVIYDRTPRATMRSEPYDEYGVGYRTVSSSLYALRFSDDRGNCRRIAVKYEMQRMKYSRASIHENNKIDIYTPDWTALIELPGNSLFNAKLKYWSTENNRDYSFYVYDRRPNGEPNQSDFPCHLTADVNYITVKIKKIGADPNVQSVADLNETHFNSPDITLVFPAVLDNEHPWAAPEDGVEALMPGGTYWVGNTTADGTPNWLSWAWGGIRVGSEYLGAGYQAGFRRPIFLFHGAPKKP